MYRQACQSFSSWISVTRVHTLYRQESDWSQSNTVVESDHSTVCRMGSVISVLLAWTVELQLVLRRVLARVWTVAVWELPWTLPS